MRAKRSLDADCCQLRDIEPLGVMVHAVGKGGAKLQHRASNTVDKFVLFLILSLSLALGKPWTAFPSAFVVLARVGRGWHGGPGSCSARR
eukprot:8159546-Alexandrium_andersonii.AAC.1